MKDMFDAKTENLPLNEARKRGRPGKVITESNFHHALEYFATRHPCKALSELDRFAPSDYRSGANIDRRIAELETRLDDTKERVKTGDTIYSTDDIERLEAHLKHVKSSKIKIPDECIERLQVWINEHATKQDWVRCLNLAARKKANKGSAKGNISIEESVFKHLKRTKAESGDLSWDELLLNMSIQYREFLKRHQ